MQVLIASEHTPTLHLTQFQHYIPPMLYQNTIARVGYRYADTMSLSPREQQERGMQVITNNAA
jgi:hypothetical protein